MSKEYLGTKTVMVVAPGIYMKCAERLARDFKRTLYHDPFWKSAFPKFTDAQVGEGLLDTEGVEKCNNFWDYVNEVDLFVFPDCGFSDWSEYLKSLGKRVWASGRAEELELERTGTLKYLEELGLKTPEYTEIEGLSNLRKHLEKQDDVYVKTNVFRGTVETFHSETYELICPLLDKLEGELSAVKDRMRFSVFKPIDGVEVAGDLYTVNGQYPAKVPFGIEVKDMGWSAKVKDFKDLHPKVKELFETISPTLEVNGYCNFFSPEMRVNLKEGLLTDFCCRFPSPVSEVYYEWLLNFSEIVWEGAAGNFIEPEYAEDFAMTLVITSDWAKEHVQAVYFPKDISKWVKLRNYTIVDDCYYIIPDLIDKNECIGVVVSFGKSLDDCADKLNKIADQIKGYQVKISCAVVADIQKEIEKAKKYGVIF